MKINSHGIQYVVELLDMIVDWYDKNLNREGFPRRSGYFTLRSRIDGRVLFHCQIGKCPDEDKAAKYANFSYEKGCRLLSHPDHVSSWQSKNDEAKQYAGAIAISNYILSFSGLPELADEAVVLILAYMIKLGTLEEVERLAKISGNTVFTELKTFTEVHYSMMQ